jgi:xanthine dehydrogenase accessory factor
MKSIYTQLLSKFGGDSPLALATIIETKGSTPQIPGASALFSPEGLCAGTVGGGLLEADVQKKAFQSLKQGVSLLYEFSLTTDISSAEGAICGGEAAILIDARPRDHTEIFQSISKSLRQRQHGVLATFIGRHSNDQASLARYWVRLEGKLTVGLEMPYAKFHEEIRESLIESKPNLLRIEGIDVFEKAEETLLFLEPIYPLPHLVIAGAGHIGQAVSHLGSLLDFEVTVIDDRPEFADKEQLPEADSIIVHDIGEAMQAVPMSSDTYIVIVTRGHKNDADALRQCIGSKAAYIGMIGSSRKVGLMREKFLQEGWATPAQWDRIHAPIGIDIQSKTVQEIAISIAAQLVLVRQQNKLLGKA